MSCEKYKKMISDRLDGNLSPEAEKKLLEHVSGCQECRNYLEFQTYLKNELQEMPAADNSDEWWAGFENRLRDRLYQEEQEEKSSLFFWAWKHLPALAGSLAVIFLAIVIMLRLPAKNDLEQLVATTMSYEETYLTLNQLMQKDENLAQKIGDELEKSVMEEINHSGLERINLENYDYYEQEINENTINNFQLENISLEDLR